MPERIVRLFQPFIVKDDEQDSLAGDEFWKTLFTVLKKKHESDPGAFDIRKGRHDIKGKVKSSTSPSVDYLYIGRDRRPEDFPDHRDPSTSEERELDLVGELVEPSYVLPIPGTRFVSICRTSSGPSSSAISAWLTSAIGGLGKDDVIDLRPVIRQDTLDRLRNSDGVQRAYVKVLPGSVPFGEAGSIAQAVNSVKGQFGPDTYVGVEVSYGNATADPEGSFQGKAELERMLMSDVELSKAEATLKTTDDRGVEKREQISFNRDAFAERVKVSSSANDQGRSSEILLAMLEAQDKFVPMLRKFNQI